MSVINIFPSLLSRPTTTCRNNRTTTTINILVQPSVAATYIAKRHHMNPFSSRSHASYLPRKCYCWACHCRQPLRKIPTIEHPQPPEATTLLHHAHHRRSPTKIVNPIPVNHCLVAIDRQLLQSPKSACRYLNVHFQPPIAALLLPRITATRRKHWANRHCPPMN